MTSLYNPNHLVDLIVANQCIFEQIRTPIGELTNIVAAGLGVFVYPQLLVGQTRREGSYDKTG